VLRAEIDNQLLVFFRLFWNSCPSLIRRSELTEEFNDQLLYSIRLFGVFAKSYKVRTYSKISLRYPPTFLKG
jgi:hypothetical protein